LGQIYKKNDTKQQLKDFLTKKERRDRGMSRGALHQSKT